MFFQLLAVSALSCRGTARRGWHLLDCVCRYLNFNSKLQQNQAQNRIQPCLPFSPCPHSRPQAGRYPVSALGLQPGGSAATPKGIPGIPGESNRLIQKRHQQQRVQQKNNAHLPRHCLFPYAKRKQEKKQYKNAGATKQVYSKKAFERNPELHQPPPGTYTSATARQAKSPACGRDWGAEGEWEGRQRTNTSKTHQNVRREAIDRWRRPE